MIVLASQSPRRKELLAELVPRFHVQPADIDESVEAGEIPEDYVQRMAREKAAAVAADFPAELVIASDTTVVVGQEIFGKPVDEADARQMLKKMSGKTHWVHTAVVLQKQGQRQERLVSAQVTFSLLTDQMVADYLKTGEYQDKAGGYGIQGAAKVFVEAIQGDFYAIVGFPVNTVAKLLKEYPEELEK
jgi:septum formation protein